MPGPLPLEKERDGTGADLLDVPFRSPIPAKACATRRCPNGWQLRRPGGRNRPVVAVETATSALELPSAQAGKVVRTYGGPGDTINVGEPLIVFEVPEHTPGTVSTVPKKEAPKRRVRLGAVPDED